MAFGLTQTSAPASEPLTTAEAKTHLNIASADTSHDTYVDTLIAAARYHVETLTNRQMVTATWAFKLDRLPSGRTPLELPIAPVASVSSVAYDDTAGDSQTFTGLHA